MTIRCYEPHREQRKQWNNLCELDSQQEGNSIMLSGNDTVKMCLECKHIQHMRELFEI